MSKPVCVHCGAEMERQEVVILRVDGLFHHMCKSCDRKHYDCFGHPKPSVTFHREAQA